MTAAWLSNQMNSRLDFHKIIGSFYHGYTFHIDYSLLIVHFQGWMDKVAVQGNFESALCSAFTGEDVKHTTIGRGV